MIFCKIKRRTRSTANRKLTMNKFELRLLLFLEQKKEILFFIILTWIGIVIRWNGRTYISGDMEAFLLPWYNEIKSMGGYKHYRIK